MFSAEYLQAYRNLPWSIRRWHIVLAVVFVLILTLGSELLRVTSGRKSAPA